MVKRIIIFLVSLLLSIFLSISSGILIASTGIIGKVLPKKKIITNIPKLVNSLTNQGSDFAESILTTDAFTKTAKADIKIGTKKTSIVGFSKGAGMIYPDMATMLGFVLTDIDIPYNLFRKMAKEAADETFNSISVDGCMSTNDMVVIMSNGLAGNKKISKKGKDYITFCNALNHIWVHEI